MQVRLVGAKDEDYEYLGIQKPKGGVRSRRRELEKKGGKLNMQDLMKLHGVGVIFSVLLP